MCVASLFIKHRYISVSYTHLRAHETDSYLVCRLLLEKSEEEIKEIAQPIWDNLVKSSNIKDYGGFTKDFSSQMLFGANEVELGKQWANNKLLTSLSEEQVFLGTIRRAQYITVLYKQTSNTQPGEFLGRLVLGIEDDLVKIFGATIY